MDDRDYLLNLEQVKTLAGLMMRIDAVGLAERAPPAAGLDRCGAGLPARDRWDRAMNERIILNFQEFSPLKAQRMIEAARAFAVEKIDGKPGAVHGTVYRWTGVTPSTVLARWTRTRTVVVTELPEKAASPNKGPA